VGETHGESVQIDGEMWDSNLEWKSLGTIHKLNMNKYVLRKN